MVMATYAVAYPETVMIVFLYADLAFSTVTSTIVASDTADAAEYFVGFVAAHQLV